MIDVHTHLAYHKALSKYFLEGICESMFEKLPVDARTEKSHSFLQRTAQAVMTDSHGDRLVAEMQRAGIERSVVLIIDLFYEYENGQTVIEEVHEHHFNVMKRHPGKLAVFSGIDPRRGEAGARLFRFALDHYQCSGLKLYPPTGFELDDQRLWPLYRICQDRGLPVLTHTGPSLPTMMREAHFPGSLATVARKFRNVNFIAAHALLENFEALAALAAESPNVYLEISGFQTDGIGGRKVISKLATAFDKIPDKLLFGSDWPLFNFHISTVKWLEHLRSLEGISAEKWNLLFRHNAEKALRPALAG
jgi:uncharacterized protein